MSWRGSVVVCGVVVAGLAMAGCGGEEGKAMRIDWDFSKAHTLDQTGWPEGELDAYTTRLMPIESVNIRLPGGTVLRENEQVSDIILYRRSMGPEVLPGREGRILEQVQVYGEPMTVQAAYRRALGYADLFDLPRGPLVDWRERRRRGADDVTDRTATGDSPLVEGKSLSRAVEMLYSSNDERPWIVMVSLYWEPPDDG